jgi:hypothetical protein
MCFKNKAKHKLTDYLNWEYQIPSYNCKDFAVEQWSSNNDVFTDGSGVNFSCPEPHFNK